MSEAAALSLGRQLSCASPLIACLGGSTAFDLAVMVSRPRVRSGQGATSPLLDVDIGLTFAEESIRLGLATSVQAGLVSVLEQTGLVRAVLMQACLRAVHNAVRRALHVALDAAPCHLTQ